MRTTSITSGVEPSGNVAVARPVITSSRGSRRRSSTYSVNRWYRNSNGLCASASSPVLPSVRPGRGPSAARNVSWSSSGTPSRSATTSIANGPAYSVTNSHVPRSANSSIVRSASRHMKASFSFKRFGVISRISSARWSVCTGGSSVGSWSLIGNSSRCSSMRSLMSSPTSGTGNPGNGPVTELHDENVAVSWYTAIASS